MRQSELETELRKLLEATLSMKPASSRKTPAPGKQPLPQPLSPESKATLLLEIAQVIYTHCPTLYVQYKYTHSCRYTVTIYCMIVGVC